MWFIHLFKSDRIMFQTCIQKYGSAIRKLLSFSESQMVLRVLRVLRMFALLSEVSDQLSSDQKSVEENVVTFKHFFFLPNRLCH